MRPSGNLRAENELGQKFSVYRQFFWQKVRGSAETKQTHGKNNEWLKFITNLNQGQTLKAKSLFVFGEM